MRAQEDPPLDFVEPIPREIESHIRGELQPGELLLLLLAADIRPDGMFGESWLAVTVERILVFRPHDSQGFGVHSIALQDVHRVLIKNYVGNGSVAVEMQDETVELVRFSLSAFYKFSGVPQIVDAVIADLGTAQQEIADPDDTGESPVSLVAHCETCGRALRSGSKICYFCLRKRETFWRLLAYIKPYKVVALLGFALTVSLTAVSLAPPYLNAILIDDVISPSIREHTGKLPYTPSPESVSLLVWVVIGLLAVYVARALTNGIRTYCLGWLGQKIVYDLQSQIFGHLQRLSLNFYNQMSTGRIMTRVTSDTEDMRRFITTGFQDMVIDTLTLVGICSWLFYMNWELALLALIPAPLMIVGTIIYTTRIHWVFHRIWRRRSRLNSMLADTIPGVRVVKAFAQEGREIRRFDGINEDLRQARMASTRMRSYFLPSIAFTTSAGSIILWWFGGNQVLSNELTLGQLQAFISYMMMFYAPVRNLCNLSEQLESAATTAERVFEIIDTEPEIEDDEDAVDPGRLAGEVEFRNVSFTYDGFARILDGINFTAAVGEMIGIVGPSGAGKSTLVNLITRFYDATDGELRLDGLPIRRIRQHRLRQQIGIVLQEPLLFHGSIAENIAYGSPGVSREQIIEAARVANAHGFVMNFPDGYDTEVGERGARLSGGERQRISIARALIGNPRILILDEATSSVDTETEFQIQEALERLVYGRTTFAIAHRLSTLKNADRLLVLERGRIAEVGTHDELLRDPAGVYRRLVDMQTEMSNVRAL